MHKNSRALNMAQEFVTESNARVRAFDKSRQIGHYKCAIRREADQSKVGVFRRKRIIRNLRASSGKPAQQRALTGVRFADESDIGDDFELKNQMSSLTFPAGRVVARSSVRRRLECRVAFAAVSPASSHDFVAVLD